MNIKNNKIFIFILIVVAIILYFLFSYLLRDKDEEYNYKNIIGNSYIANDDSYLFLNKDKTFYWYKDKDNKDTYYYGKYQVFRGENAIKYITSNLAYYEITEEEQRNAIKDKDDKIDTYYLLIINNEKIVDNGVEQDLNKETKYYGFANKEYTELDFINIDANNTAIFKLDK